MALRAGKAKGKPTVKARAGNAKAVMEHGTFTWHTDLPAPLGGSNEAPSPTALLSALAGCSVVFIRDALARNSVSAWMVNQP
jgi:uncharacterized OsmC-like protein